ncbi:glycosyltransferase family 2 protein [Clostridium perfringens]|uniref:glycosyltransferase family 2 protein n=1 Tax=Clostridium perfringens TaxID=1502 RepID=UPI001C88645F|nr:glycosyltransferase [Clostridium perfringens]
MNNIDKGKVSVSIVMGIYNCEKTLKYAIDSIINQSYLNWELIMCDDCSTDSTYEIALDYTKKYKNIYLIKNKSNKGLAYTLNKCIEKAKGEYIARQDADDISLENRIEIEIDELRRDKSIDFIGTSISLFDSENIWGQRIMKKYPNKYDLVKGSQFVHPTVIIRKDVIDSVGGYTVDKYTRRGQDYDLWMKLYSKGYRGVNLQKRLYLFREGKDDFKRKKLNVRFNEAIVRFRGYRKMNINIYLYIYILKPIIVGLIPLRLQHKYRMYKDKN